MQTALQQTISNFFGINNQAASSMLSFFKEEHLTKDQFFVKKEQYCDRLSFIQEGYLRVYAESGNKEITQWISVPNYFITELSSYIFGMRSRFHIRAISDCVLYTIKKSDYAQLSKVIPNWPAIENKFISSCFITLENRVFNFLSLSAEERYDKLFEENKDIFNQVPLQYIASMLGMSPETFSRIRNKKLS